MLLWRSNDKRQKCCFGVPTINDKNVALALKENSKLGPFLMDF
jgi:hypothetical protein